MCSLDPLIISLARLSPVLALPFLTRQGPIYFLFSLVHMPPPANHAGKMGAHEINRKETYALILDYLAAYSFLYMISILGL